MKCFSLPFLFLASCPAWADMTNRWSFNNPIGSAPAGTVIVDSIGGANGIVRCGTATANQGAFTGTGLTLPGTTSGNQLPANISAYVDLPNGIISSKLNLTVEIWATAVAARSWQRLFDFGKTNVTSAAAMGPGAAMGELLPTATAVPGASISSDDLALSINRGTAANTQRMAARLDGGTELILDTARTFTAGTQYHIAFTYTDSAGAYGRFGGQIAWYRDATLSGTRDLPFKLSSLEDVNNWLGRSQFSADSCANINYNEVRLYDHAMTLAEITASRNAGVNPAFTAPVAVADAVTMNRATKARVRVLGNDTGPTGGGAITIVSLPTHGTAVPQSDGTVLYTNTGGGSAANDSFSYQATGPGGVSNTATVMISFADTPRLASPGLNVPATPPPTSAAFVAAFPSLSFASPICLRTLPGNSQRLFVVERGGTLRLIPDVTVPTPGNVSVFTIANLIAGRTPAETLQTGGEQGFLSVAFHPNFTTNGYVYLFYSVQFNALNYERISRVTLSNPNTNAPTLLAGSEVVLIEQQDEATNHNGGDMHFGPDGYLYISLGDEGNQNDSFNNSQRIDKDFFSAVMRIDVDKRAGNPLPNVHPNPVEYPTNPPASAVKLTGAGGTANYAIPADNPYVLPAQGGTWAGSFNGNSIANTAYVRSEFYAVGLRNPWRMAFDEPTGELWVGDVGGSVWEEVNVVTKGRNYGWAFREGAATGPKSGTAPANFATLYGTNPVYSYDHGTTQFSGASITGGVVYRGTRFPSLTGLYFFCDYVSGNVWSLTRTPTLAVNRLFGETSIVAFGHDPSNGDVLACNLATGSIQRLVLQTTSTAYPTTLSATRLFAELSTLTPSPGVLSYTVNLPFWSDYAEKSRFLSIPNGTSQMTWARDGNWTFPAGQLWLKHFDMEMVRGNVATKKRLETRLLVKNSTGAYGVTYQWNDAGTEAFLVPDEGADVDLTITVAGSPLVQRWRFPSRAECQGCHNAAAGFALSTNTRQLNMLGNLGPFSGNQLEMLSQYGFLTNTPDSVNVLARHPRGHETQFSAEARARAWLAVNCSYCHMPGTGIQGDFDVRAHLPLAQTSLINGVASNNGGNSQNKLVVPGDTVHSIVYNRAGATNGLSRMPPFATSVVDTAGLTLLSDWIGTALPTTPGYDSWRLQNFGSLTTTEGAPDADPDHDGTINQAEFLAASNPWSGNSFLKPSVAINGQTASVTLDLPPNRSAVIEVSSDLTSWILWDTQGNHGLPRAGGSVTITGPAGNPRQLYRAKITLP